MDLAKSGTKKAPLLIMFCYFPVFLSAFSLFFNIKKGWDFCSHPFHLATYSQHYPNVFHMNIKLYFDFAKSLLCGARDYY